MEQFYSSQRVPVLVMPPKAGQAPALERLLAGFDHGPGARVVVLVPPEDAEPTARRLAQLRPRGLPAAAGFSLEAAGGSGTCCDALLRRTAETLNACPDLAHALAAMADFLAGEAGWRPMGVWLFNGPARLDGVTAELRPLLSAALLTGLPAVLLQPQRAPRLALPVMVQGMPPLALQCFTVPAAPADLLAIAEPLARQMAVVAQRSQPVTRGHGGDGDMERMSLAVMEEVARVFSHELAQPLAAALNYASVLRRRAASPPDQQLSQRLQGQLGRACQRLQELGAQLVYQGELEWVDLPRLVCALAPRYGSHDGGLILRLDPALPPLLTYRSYLEEIVQTLLEVARELAAGDSRPRIQLELEQRGGGVGLIVSGAPEALLEALRQRMDGPMHRLRRDALGLRLALSRALAETLGGRLALEPHPSALAFELPLSEPAQVH